ncbi:Ig-like domain-containing protein [Pontibacter oryzae]|nr:gliding motility-associated C-terminal domain-containing protein [Pontibacter oryzae]
MRQLLPGLVCLLFLQLWSTFSSYVFAQTCPPTVSIAGAICTTGQVTLTASQAETYLWSTGQTTQSIEVKEAGTYSVTTTRADGCKGTSEVVTLNAGPDATVADPITYFTSCSYSGNSSTFELTIENASTTKETNTLYEINWGDGATTSLGNDFETATHIYKSAGSFRLTVTAYDNDGCSSTHEERVFIGSNPSLGLASRGNTNDCAPATFTFDILNTEGNSVQTVYTFQFDDGSAPITFTHANLPKTIEHTFTESSRSNPGSSFTLSATAVNPCGTTPATVGGIKISKGPIADFDMSKTLGCVNVPIKLTDKTISGFNANAGNTNAASTYMVNWEISPADGWEYTSGTFKTNSPMVKFTKPGTYTIQMTSTPTGVNTKCSSSATTKIIQINDDPKADFRLSSNGNCAPAVFTAANLSTGEDLKYVWQVTPAEGWQYANGTKASTKDAAFQFTKAGSYVISLSAINNCNTSLMDTTIVIKEKPQVQLPAAQVYCGPQSIRFTQANASHKPEYDAKSGTITKYKWTVNGPGSTQFTEGTDATSANPVVSFTDAGKYTIQVIATNECGDSEAAIQEITINALPQLQASSPKPTICIGESTTISITGADIYTWAPAPGLTAATGSTVTVQPETTTTYTVTGTNSQTGCKSTTNFTVVVNPLPEVKVSTNAAAICAGQGTAILTAVGADTYTWAPAEGLSATTGSEVSASPAKTTTYTVTGTNTETGCSSTATVTVVVNPLPAVDAGKDLTLCNSPVPTKLNASPAGGTWSGANVTADGTFTPPTATGVYELVYTYTDALGCSASDKLNITVTETPVADAGQDMVVCLNSGAFALTASPTGGIWSGSALVTAEGTFTPSATGTHTLTYTYGNGSCESTDQIQITVNALPEAPTVSAATLCPGFGTTLSVENPQGSIAWYNAATGGTLLGEGATFDTPTLQETTTYYVQTTIAGGCTSPRRAVTVTVRPATPAPIVTPVILCGPGQSATLVAEGNATTYVWYDTESRGTALFTGKAYKTETLSSSKTYYVQAITEGCLSPRTAVTVTVNPLITQNTIQAVAAICAGQAPALLTGSSPVGGDGKYTYMWESSIIGPDAGFAPIATATGKDLQPSTLNRTTWFRRTVNSATCSDVSAAIEVKVTPVISNNTISGEVIICENTAPDELIGSQPTGGNESYTFIWEMSTTGESNSFTEVPVSNNGQNYQPGKLSQTTWFRRKVKSGTCAEHVSQPVKITVYKPISGNSITNAQTVCAGTLPAVLEGSQPKGGNGDYTFTWEMSANGTDFERATGQNNGINYAPAALNTSTWFRRVVKGGPCGPNTSNAVEIKVNPVIANNTISADQLICSGQTPAALKGSVPSGGDERYTFRWLVSTTGANGNYTLAAGNNNSEDYTPAALTATAWYKREVLSGTCTSTSNIVEVTVVPLPTAPTVAPLTVCENTAATLTVTDAKGDFAWFTQAQGGTAVATGRSFETPALAQTTTYYVESINSNGCGSPVRASVTVTVEKNITENTLEAVQGILCAGQTPALLMGTTPKGGSGTYTYAWERSTESATTGFAPIAGATKATYQPGALSETTWFKRVVRSGSCAQSMSEAIEVSVVPVISANTISAAQTLCEGDTPENLEGSTPAGGDGKYIYLWESSTDGNMFAAAAGDNTKPNYQAPAPLSQNIWYRRVVRSGPCAQDISKPVKVTVQPAIRNNKLASTAQTICAGEAPKTIIATQPTGGNGTYTYIWEQSADGVNFSEAPGTHTNSSYAPQTLEKDAWFRRKVISGQCYSFSDAVKVTVNPGITANSISESQTICVDTTPALLSGSQPQGGTGSYTYAWEYSNTGANGNFKPVAQNGKGKDLQPGVLGTTTWFRRVVTSGECTHVSNLVEITVSPAIQKNTVMAPQTIYAGQIPAPLTGSTPVGGNDTYSYTWEQSADGVNFTAAPAPNNGKSYSPKALTKDTWFRRIVYSGGCESISNIIKITVTPAIGNNNIQADQVICFNNVPATLTGSAPKGGEGDYTFLWQQSTSGPGKGWTTADGKSNELYYTPQALTQDTWFRRIVISDINTDTSNAVMIQVKPAMSNNKISTSQTICYGTAPSALQGTLPNGGSGTYTYLWEMSTSSATSGWTTAPGDNQRQDYVSGPLTKTTWFRRVVTSESCTGLVSEAIKVTVTPLPEKPQVTGASICAGNSTTLTATGNGGKLEWFTSASGGTPVATGSSFKTPVLQFTTTYYVQQVSQSCASERHPVTVKVTEPQLNAGPDVTIVKGRSTQLSASGGVTYTWSPAEGMDNPNIANPTVTPEKTTVYKVTATTEGGCTFSDEVVVTVLPFVDIPNTFTPNQDGINDTWEIADIDKYTSCKVQVFNQWGNLVFSSEGYKQPWDGRQNGKPLPMATYYYIIKLDTSEKPLTGSVTIVK